MTLHASWVHGNSLTVEYPENLSSLGHFGWGADMGIRAGRGSWFHIALPTPVIVADTRTHLLRVFLLFRSEPGMGIITGLHVYDGSSPIQEFNELDLEGEHRLALDDKNTFHLAVPHSVNWGVGISFFFLASKGLDSVVPPARLIVAAAGADYSQ